MSGTWAPSGQKQKHAFSHSPQKIASISDESHKAYWQVAGLRKIENFYLLAQGASLYDFYINHSAAVTKNDVIFF